MSNFVLKYHASILKVGLIAVIPLMFGSLFLGTIGMIHAMWIIVALQVLIFTICCYTLHIYRKFVNNRENEWQQHDKAAREKWPQAYEYLDSVGKPSDLDLQLTKEDRNESA